jgi:hypothetical protein
MKILLTLILTLSMGTMAFSQTEKEKDDKDDKGFIFDKKTNEFSDGTGVLFKMEKVKSEAFPGSNNFHFTDKTGKRLVVLSYRRFQDVLKMDKSNPEGNVYYFEVSFPDTHIPSCQVAHRPAKKIAKMLYERKIIQGGALNESAAKEFSAETGNHISHR